MVSSVLFAVKTSKANGNPSVLARNPSVTCALRAGKEKWGLIRDSRVSSELIHSS
jgi:hypothetical protein